MTKWSPSEPLQASGRSIELDAEGYLRQLSDWSPEVAAQLAQRENLTLTPEHWYVIESIRKFYAEFQLSPANRPLARYLKAQGGPEWGDSLRLNLLFKGTPAKLAAKLAGLPKPTHCL